MSLLALLDTIGTPGNAVAPDRHDDDDVKGDNDADDDEDDDDDDDDILEVDVTRPVPCTVPETVLHSSSLATEATDPSEGYVEQDIWNKIYGTRCMEQDIWNKIYGTRYMEQYVWNI